MDWAAIITAIGGVIGAIGGIYAIYVKRTQDRYNKETDYKIDKMREEDKAINKRRADNSMIIFGVLWDLLYATKADRAYIVQPHPLGNEEMLTIYFEVKRKGAEPMKPHIQKMKISDVAKFASDLVKNLFMYITNIGEQVKDRYAEAIFSSCGTQGAIVKRLSDNRHDWVGSLVCEFTDGIEIGEQEAQTLMHKAATDIQFILPEIKD